MPERHISYEQEEAIGDWLWKQSANGVEVVNTDCQVEGTVLDDKYRVGEGYLNFHTDLADRSTLNEIEYDDNTGNALSGVGIFPAQGAGKP